MSQVNDFKEEFVKAYISGNVPCLGFHHTSGDKYEGSMRRGLKWFPQRHDMIRPEMGVHLLRIKPPSEETSIDKIKGDFDLLAGRGYTKKIGEVEDLPGVVLLKENIPRERQYPGKPEAGTEILYSWNYVPVIAGLEKTVHVLVPRNFILGVAFLERQELEEIKGKVNRKIGFPGKMLHDYERKRIKLEGFVDWEIGHTTLVQRCCGRLLLYKLMNYLIK